MTRAARTTEVDWHDDREIATAATSSGLRSALTSWVRFAVQAIAMVAVARLIGPDQYGAAAALLVAVTGAEVLRSGGVTWLIAHDGRLTPAAASTLHVLSRTIGTACAAAWCLVGLLPLSGALPGGRWGAFAMAVVFFAAGSGAVPTAVLGRNLRFGAIGTAEVIAAVLSTTVAVTVAANGGGLVSLLLQAAVYAVALRLGIAVACPWRPGARVPLGSLRTELAFAGNASLMQALEWLARSLDRVFVAVVFGEAAAGFYVQAGQLVLLPLEQVSGPLRRVAVPVLAKLAGDTAALRRTFTTLMTVSCTALWPVFATIGVLSTPLVGLLFGPDWLDTAQVFLGMLPGAIAIVVTSTTIFLALALGAARRQTRWELWCSRPLTVLAFLVAAPHGFDAMVLTVSAVTVLVAVPGFLVVTHATPVRLRDLGRAVWFPTVLASACAGGAAVVQHVLPTGLPALALAAASAVVIWSAGALAHPTTRRLAVRAGRRAR